MGRLIQVVVLYAQLYKILLLRITGRFRSVTSESFYDVYSK